MQRLVAEANHFRVRLYAGEDVECSLAAVDPEKDLAVLQTKWFPTTPLVPVTLGSSDGLQVGHRVYTITIAGGEPLFGIAA